MRKTHNDATQAPRTIPCIGIDGRLHECEPHKDTATCGCVVVEKKVGAYDYANRRSCYPCTY